MCWYKKTIQMMAMNLEQACAQKENISGGVGVEC
jgi:hypothetical protein